MSIEKIECAVLAFAGYVARAVDALIALLVAALLVLVTSQFIDRNYVTLWHDSPEEYVKIGLVWLCFLGFVRASATGETIRITFLHDLLPKGIQRLLDVVLDLLLLTVVCFLALKSWEMIQTAQMQLILGTPLTLDVPVYGMFIGFVLLVPMICWRLFRALTGRPRLHDSHSAHEVVAS
jgi:TRAP-type C4-dicarboxylate transport system permease small subunit